MKFCVIFYQGLSQPQNWHHTRPGSVPWRPGYPPFPCQCYQGLHQSFKWIFGMNNKKSSDDLFKKFRTNIKEMEKRKKLNFCFKFKILNVTLNFTFEIYCTKLSPTKGNIKHENRIWSLLFHLVYPNMISHQWIQLQSCVNLRKRNILQYILSNLSQLWA